MLRESDYEDILFEMKTFCSKIFEYSSNEKQSGELTFVQTFWNSACEDMKFIFLQTPSSIKFSQWKHLWVLKYLLKLVLFCFLFWGLITQPVRNKNFVWYCWIFNSQWIVLFINLSSDFFFKAVCQLSVRWWSLVFPVFLALAFRAVFDLRPCFQSCARLPNVLCNRWFSFFLLFFFFFFYNDVFFKVFSFWWQE